MTKNVQSFKKQNVNSVKYKQAETILQMKLRGKSSQTENCMKAKGDYQNRVHSDQMVLVIVRWGGWKARAVAKSNSRGPPGWRLLRSDSSREGQTGMLDHLSNGHKTLKVFAKSHRGLPGSSP